MSAVPWPRGRDLLGELQKQVLVLGRVDGQHAVRVAGDEVETLCGQVFLDRGQVASLEHGAADALNAIPKPLPG